MIKKFKSLLSDDALFYALLLVLVAIASFGLGRQSINQSVAPASPAGAFSSQMQSLEPIQVETDAKALGSGTTVVASKSGTKYHLEGCPGAKQIKQANKISFNSVAAAEAAGYTPAANCPGLQ